MKGTSPNPLIIITKLKTCLFAKQHRKGQFARKYRSALRAICLLIACIPISLFAQSSSASANIREAESLIQAMESQEVFSSAFIQGRLIINDRFGTKTSTFDSFSLGSEYSLIEFTSIEERGQKILRSEDDLYIYYPDADEVIRLYGSALSEGILGSDASYEDITGDKSLLSDYEVEGLRYVEEDGKELARIELRAKRSSVPYPRQVIYIDNNQQGIRSEKYSLSNRLIKEEEVLDFTEQAGYTIPSRLRINDTLKNNSYSEFIIDRIDTTYPLDEDFFSIDELTW